MNSFMTLMFLIWIVLVSSSCKRKRLLSDITLDSNEDINVGDYVVARISDKKCEIGKVGHIRKSDGKILFLTEQEFLSHLWLSPEDITSKINNYKHVPEENNEEKNYSEPCSVCYDRYPVSLKAPCGHEHCLGCMQNILGIKRNCPLCRASIGKNVRDFEIMNYPIAPETNLETLQNSFKYICGTGDTKMIQKWMKYGVEFHAEELCYASYFKNFENLKFILDQGVDANAIDKNGGHALTYACENGSLEIVEHLVSKAGSNVKQTRKNEQTPLWIAAANGHYEIVQFLLNNGALEQINKPNVLGLSALLASCKKGNINLIKLLVQNGADVNQIDFKDRTPIWVASTVGELDILKYLIQNGGNTNENQYVQVATPFLMSCLNDHSDVMKFWLEEQEVNVNQIFKDENKDEEMTCLSLALKNENFEMVNYLKEKINFISSEVDEKVDEKIHKL